MIEKPSTGLRPRSRTGAERRGGVLLLVLVVGTVLILVLLGVLRRIASQAQQQRGQQNQAQAVWLAESALQRAAARLATDASYRGETWQLPPEQLDGRHPGRVAISVERLSGPPSRHAVRVVADFPDHPQDRVRRSTQLVLELPSGDH